MNNFNHRRGDSRRKRKEEKKKKLLVARKMEILVLRNRWQTGTRITCLEKCNTIVNASNRISRGWWGCLCP